MNYGAKGRPPRIWSDPKLDVYRSMNKKRKLADVSFPADMYDEIMAESERLGRSFSAMLQLAWKIKKEKQNDETEI